VQDIFASRITPRRSSILGLKNQKYAFFHFTFSCAQNRWLAYIIMFAPAMLQCMRHKHRRDHRRTLRGTYTSNHSTMPQFLFYSSLFLLGVLVSVEQLQQVQALAGVGASNLSVKCVTAPMDICALADLRFTEWIMAEDETTTDRPPSAQAFRMATAEITAERSAQGAVAMIAQTKDGTTVGAAELSPIELQECFDTNSEEANNGSLYCGCYYVTDVVTARTHRRMGVGKALMEAIETEASKKGTTGTSWLLLHVKDDNVAALNFYKRGGYLEPPAQLLQKLDTDRLAQNAGTTGQILLSKPIPPPTKHNKKEGRTNNGGGGFGGNSAAKKKPKKPSRS
jgi:GNAT superfamily N-acetyltransferase